MAQRATRIDRFAQMNKQEEIIAKKRQEILEKQRTAQLAKAVVAAQTLAAKMKENEINAAAAAAAAVVENNETATAAQQEEEQNDAATECADTAKMEKVEEKISNKKDLSAEPTDSTTRTSFNSLKGNKGKIHFAFKRAQQAAHVSEQPPLKVQNSFCNDGSFLDHFKKILEKHEPKPVPVPAVEPITAETELTETNDDAEATAAAAATDVDDAELTNSQHSTNADEDTAAESLHTQQTAAALAAATPALLTSSVPPPPPPRSALPFAFNPNLLPTNHFQQQQAMQTPPHAFFAGAAPHIVPPPAPPMLIHHTAPPPPPPPMALANLATIFMIPAPEFDLNALAKTQQMNMELQQQQQQQQHYHFQQHQQHQQQQQQKQFAEQQAQQQQQQQQQQQLEQELQMQTQQHQQQQQQTEQQQQVFSDNIQLPIPTTIDSLIDMVADNGDDYEDKLRSRKNDLHPAMWFLFDKNCEQYQQYSAELNERRLRRQQQQQLQQQLQQQPPPPPPLPPQEESTAAAEAAEVASEDTQSDKQFEQQEQQEQQQQQQQQQAQQTQTDSDKYDPESVISNDIDSDDEYMRGMMDRNTDNIRRRIECRNELSEEERQEREAEEEEERKRLERKKQRKSRWGEKVDDASSSTSVMAAVNTSFGNQNKPVLTVITRTDPALLQYARLNYGSTNLSEEDWQKCEEHFKVNLLYQDMLRKRDEIDSLARAGKFKFEYDSDEDVEGGTWEHKLRCAEMEATQAWAAALTKQSEGKHHIGDFLPPEELKKFMEQYDAKKNNRQPDLSDYKEFKLSEDNIGFQMLKKFGWKEGQGLGTDGAGIVDPVNKAPQRDGNQGLGVQSAATPEERDNEYDAYRKRMMLAYRFRPNPLNNPRRAYY